MKLVDWSRPSVRVISGTGTSATEAGRLPALDGIRIRAIRGFDRLAQGVTTGEVLFFAGALAIYAVTRFVHLDRFPIYFFADEAVQGVLGRQLFERGWHDPEGHLFPAFFNAHGFYNPLVTVYFHALAFGLFGSSIEILRSTSAFVTLFGAVAVSLTLKLVFRARSWWSGVLLLAAMPGWFLHSRTAFETAMMASFYAGTLLFYLLYRCRSPHFLYPAIFFAALTFYSYGNGQLVIGVALLLLFFSDLPYHFRHFRTIGAGLLLAAALAFPYWRFRSEHPQEVGHHLRTLDTYVLRPIPLSEKLREFAKRYAYGVSPRYWFVPNDHDLVRHRMKGYGQIPLWSFPLFLLGVGVCIVRWKSPPHRAVILAALATPVGGALTEIGITRAMAFVIPASLLAALGLEFLVERLRNRNLRQGVLAAVFFAISVASLGMLRDALQNGPYWFKDYGLYGMQWGARQVFSVVSDYLRRPGAEVRLTSSWANAGDVFLAFFRPNETRVRFETVESFVAEKRDLNDSTIVMMTPGELKQANDSGKFRPVRISRLLRYPDGTPGFYFTRLAYVDGIDEVFSREKAERRKPVVEDFNRNGETITVSHSRFGDGRLDNVFDGDVFTLVRFLEANPAFFELRFPSQKRLRGIAADFGTMTFSLTVSLWPDDASPPTTYAHTYTGLPSDPHVELRFANAPQSVRRMRVEIHDLAAGATAQIHVRELRLL